MNAASQFAFGSDGSLHSSSPLFHNVTATLDQVAPWQQSAPAMIGLADPVVSRLSYVEQSTLAPPKIQQLENGVHRCGQCYENKAADHFCQDCNEFFCWSCGAEMHRRGNRSQHRLFEVEKSNSSLPGQLDLNRPRSAIHYCFSHPSEEVMCFCNTCNMRLICNICAISCARGQHDVLTMREMMARLPEDIAVLNASVEEQLSKLAQSSHAQNVNEWSCEREVMHSISSYKRKASRDVKSIQELLNADEESYLYKVEGFAAEIRRDFEKRMYALVPPPVPNEQLHEILGSNMVLALNRYARLLNDIESTSMPKATSLQNALQEQSRTVRKNLEKVLSSMEADLHRKVQRITIDDELRVANDDDELRLALSAGSSKQEAAKSMLNTGTQEFAQNKSKPQTNDDLKPQTVARKGQECRKIVGKYYNGNSIWSRSQIRSARLLERGFASS